MTAATSIPVALNLLNQKLANGTYLIPTPQRIGTDDEWQSDRILDVQYSVAPTEKNQFLVNRTMSSRRSIRSRRGTFYSN